MHMYLLKDVREAILSVFGLERFSAGLQKLQSNYGDQTDSLDIEVLWIANLHKYAKLVHLAILHSNLGTKGLLLFRPFHEAPNRPFGGPSPLYAVDLVGWEDPVLDALTCLDLVESELPAAPRYEPPLAVGRREADCEADLLIYTRAIQGMIVGIGWPDTNPTFATLGEAIVSAVEGVIDIYDDRDMHNLLKTTREIGW